MGFNYLKLESGSLAYEISNYFIVFLIASSIYCCRMLISPLQLQAIFTFDIAPFYLLSQQNYIQIKLRESSQITKFAKNDAIFIEIISIIDQSINKIVNIYELLIEFHTRIIKLTIYTFITFHSMKPNLEITKTATQDLQKILNNDVLYALTKRFKEERGKPTIGKKYQENQYSDIKTPSTIDTTLRRRGSAISKSKRPQSRSKLKTKTSQISNNQIFQNTQTTVTRPIKKNQQQRQQSVRADEEVEKGTVSRRVLTDRAVYYGNVELPYLHSSDAISSLYERPKAQQSNPQPLINPPTSIAPALLTNLKNLYLYYTSLDSLRQLGTGWSNLKSLTVMCSHQLKDLSGLSIFPSLQYLFVPHNNICQISDLMYHSSLRCVDLSDNRLQLFDQVQYLYTIANLEWVDISHNPIVHQKQQYRIIAQNLGSRLQLEDQNKLHQYQLSQYELDYELFSYTNMQTSCNLVKEINEQILKQDIKVGEVWRKVCENKQNPNQQQDITNDIEIITRFYQYENQDDSDLDGSLNNQGIQLRVTPLTQYITDTVNIDPLKKYFYNKICPQSKVEKQKERESKITIGKLQSLQKQKKEQITDLRPKRFALTQKVSATLSQQKQAPRLASVSLKKRLGKLSVNKNSNKNDININFASTASAVLNNLKYKQQAMGDLGSLNVNANSGIKFMTKRKLLTKHSEQLVSRS